MLFNIGAGEMILIALVLLIAVGPEQLPSVIRRTGQAVGQLRSMSDRLRSDFMSSMDEIERAADPRSWAESGSDDMSDPSDEVGDGSDASAPAPRPSESSYRLDGEALYPAAASEQSADEPEASEPESDGFEVGELEEGELEPDGPEAGEPESNQLDDPEWVPPFGTEQPIVSADRARGEPRVEGDSGSDESELPSAEGLS